MSQLLAVTKENATKDTTCTKEIIVTVCLNDLVSDVIDMLVDTEASHINVCDPDRVSLYTIATKDIMHAHAICTVSDHERDRVAVLRPKSVVPESD